MRWLVGAVVVSSLGCGRDVPAQDPDDRGDAAADAGRLDAAPLDAAAVDVGTVDLGPDAVVDAGVRRDAAEVDAQVPDAEGVPDVALPDAGSPDAFVPPDACVPVDEVCDGVDDDCDGAIDEGIANPCGGCGPVPETGCQAWRVEMTQDPQGTLDPDRIVALLAGIGAYETREIPGGVCDAVTLPDQPMDAHLGVVQVVSPRRRLFLLPEYDARLGGHRYAAQDVEGRVDVHRGGDVVEVEAAGGAVLGRFEGSITAPEPLDEVEAGDLEGLLDVARGDADEARIAWEPAGLGGVGTVRLFVGGSRPLFTSPSYRGIEHYQLDAVLADDGDFAPPRGFFGAGVPDSSVWVWMARERSRRVIMGGHSVTLSAGQRVELRGNGPLAADEPHPFDVVSPAPEDARLFEGRPLVVGWTALPEGKGPLVVSLTLIDGESGVTRQVACVADAPDAGQLVLPADLIGEVPTGAGDLRQLSVRWGLADETLEEPDIGRLTRSATVILQLEPGQP